MLQLHYVHPIRSYNSTEELLHVYVYRSNPQELTAQSSIPAPVVFALASSLCTKGTF